MEKPEVIPYATPAKAPDSPLDRIVRTLLILALVLIPISSLMLDGGFLLGLLALCFAAALVPLSIIGLWRSHRDKRLLHIAALVLGIGLVLLIG